jgi:RNA polymerase sigma-70 factor (ECF subfamily)
MEENLRLFRLSERMAGAAAVRVSREPPEELLSACRSGDRAAFEELFALTSDRVFSIALHFLGDPSAASDVTQEVFLKLLVRIDRFHEKARFSTWLYRVVANAVIDYRRARRPMLPMEACDAARLVWLGAGPEEAAHLRERRARVREAVRRLPPRLRLVLVLRHVAQLSYEEIGGALDLSIGTVASRLSRAHRALAALLEKGEA